MSHEAELPMPGAMLDESQSPLHTPTPRRSPASLTSHHSRTSSTHCHPEAVQTVQGDDLFDEEERMALNRNAITRDPQPSGSESAVTADEGPQPSSSDVRQPSLQWASNLRRMRDASDSLNGGSETGYRGSWQDKCRFGEVDYSQALRRELYEKKEITSGLRMHMRSLKATCHSLEERNQRLQRTAQHELEGQQSKIVELQNIIQQRKEEQEALHTQLVMDRQAASLQHRNEIESLRQEMKANMDSQLQDMLKESRETITQVLEQRNLELNEKLNTVRAAMRVEKETEIANLERRYALRGRQGTTTSRSPQPDSMDTMETRAISSGLSMPAPATSSERHTSTPTPVAQARPPLPRMGPSARAPVPPARVPGPSVPVSETNMPRARSTEREPSAPPHDQLPNLQTSEFTEALTRGVETALKNIFANGQFSRYVKQSPRKRAHVKEIDEIRVVETKEERNFYLRYARRVTILRHIVELKAEGNGDDADAWRWLLKLVETLGEHGMSSDESDAGNDIEAVLRVKNMDWRRSIARELDVVDLQRLVDVDVFSPQGSRPLKRIRAPGNLESCRTAVKGLPISLYDGAWIASLTQRQLEELNASEERFLWMQVAVAS
ncbi:hypothetical protein PISMIDRAFT_24207 [Pisolithus microcarpus 441]|uniref:Uncharacterized protein n=1 Tax=Pisolithus microcarpus 441 TaxID=765257 RepID=A0A0C9YUE1_9AGAM|nr:hypothetical protein PISMIDRAFT_24207 [Pisolithus microcarpus 441]